MPSSRPSTLKPLFAAVCLLAALTACQKKSEPRHDAPPAASQAANANANAMAAGPTSGGAAAGGQALATPDKPAPFDLNSVPLSQAKLPAFPFLDYPEKLEAGYRTDRKPQFDEVHVVAGKELRRVEGLVLARNFPHTTVGLSALESMRNYENLIKSLGGVKVNQLMPADAEFRRLYPESQEALEKKTRVLGLNNGGAHYQMYLVRTPGKNIWLGLGTYDDGLGTWLLSVEEKAFEQTVGLTKAEEMAQGLKQSGEVALYLAFDTDSAVIKDESKPVVAEIAKLLKGDPSLRLRVEGHTDNQGAAAHNLKLSQMRAQSVTQALAAQGIESSRLQPAGFGQDKPIGDNTSEAGRAKNRRVMLVKVG